MLMIGTTRLAKECFEAWRQDRDLARSWEDLGQRERDSWRAVAAAAANLLVEALGASTVGANPCCRMTRDPESMNLTERTGSTLGVMRTTYIDSGSRVMLVRSGRPATLSEAYTSAFGMHDETGVESTESVAGGFIQ